MKDPSQEPACLFDLTYFVPPKEYLLLGGVGRRCVGDLSVRKRCVGRRCIEWRCVGRRRIRREGSGALDGEEGRLLDLLCFTSFLLG